MYEKVDSLVKVDAGILERIERLEKKVFEEPDIVTAFLKKDLEQAKRKMESEITAITKALSEDQTENNVTEKKAAQISPSPARSTNSIKSSRNSKFES